MITLNRPRPTTGSEVTLNKYDGTETIRIRVTGKTRLAFYGQPLVPGDNRVAFPYSIWTVA